MIKQFIKREWIKRTLYCTTNFLKTKVKKNLKTDFLIFTLISVIILLFLCIDFFLVAVQEKRIKVDDELLAASAKLINIEHIIRLQRFEKKLLPEVSPAG